MVEVTAISQLVQIWYAVPILIGGSMLLFLLILLIRKQKSIYYRAALGIIAYALSTFLLITMEVFSIFFPSTYPLFSTIGSIGLRLQFIDEVIYIFIVLIGFPLVFVSKIAWDQSISLWMRYLMIAAFMTILLPVVTIGAVVFMEQVVYQGQVCMGFTCPVVLEK